jgi:hypothetical protein
MRRSWHDFAPQAIDLVMLSGARIGMGFIVIFRAPRPTTTHRVVEPSQATHTSGCAQQRERVTGHPGNHLGDGFDRGLVNIGVFRWYF